MEKKYLQYILPKKTQTSINFKRPKEKSPWKITSIKNISKWLINIRKDLYPPYLLWMQSRVTLAAREVGGPTHPAKGQPIWLSAGLLCVGCWRLLTLSAVQRPKKRPQLLSPCLQKPWLQPPRSRDLCPGGPCSVLASSTRLDTHA